VVGATGTEASPPLLPRDAAAGWRSGTARYGLLLATVFVFVAVQGILPPSDAQQVIVAGLSGASLLLALRAAGLGGHVLAVAGGAAAIVLVLSVVRATVGGDPFFANGDTATTSRCLYFSFTTLTTVGYGDFVARSNLGHTLAVFEALLGQIYLVTVVSVLVSNLGRPARPGRSV